MSIGLYLLGQFKKPQLQPNEVLRQFEVSILNECTELLPATRYGSIDGKFCLFSTFHPSGEEVEIVLQDPSHVTVSAKTSTVGPGYHIFLCDLIRRWTNKLSIIWQEFTADDDTMYRDETDYFFSRNERKVYDEMERWLRTLTGSFFDGTIDRNSKEIALCMPMNVLFESDSLAITQLGPRDEDWLYRMSQGSIHPREFFPWYEAGLNAEYHLGRALAQMWSDVRWRKPVNNHEAALLRSTLKSLSTSYRMDPSLNFPWNEWKELLNLAGESVPDFVYKKASGPGYIGYRRASVKTCLPGNWWIKTEGSFSAFESEQDGTLSSFDPPREIWFTAYSFSTENPEEAFNKTRDNTLSEKHELIQQENKYISVADISQNNKGNRHYLLRSKNIGVLCRSICTLVFQRPEDRDWAIRTWRSLKPPIGSE